MKLTNKSTESIDVTRNKVTASIGSYSQLFRMASSPLNYDVSQGKKWGAKYKAWIECESNIVRIIIRRRRVTIRALGSSDSELSVNAVK